MPRPKRLRPPPGFPEEPQYRRQRTAVAAPAPAPAPEGDAGHNCDLSHAFGRCRALLKDLLGHDDGWVFEAPVDTRHLGLRDYYTVVDEPMDLGTVLRRLERRRYSDPAALAADVRLTFRNAMAYNNPGDPVYESAAELSAIFEDGWASIQQDLPPPPPTDADRMVRFRDELPRLPVPKQRTVAGFLQNRDVCLREKKGKMFVNLRKADSATLDEIDRLAGRSA